jgi:hypothetical protein
MRRSGLFVVLALVTALGCKSSTVGGIGGVLDIYTQLDAGPITGTTFSFGTACPNFPVTQQFYIVNTGIPPVTISNVTLSSTSPFSLVPPVATGDVEPGNNVPQTVQFNPTSMGPQPSATMTVATTNAGLSDGGPASYSINLSGNGSNGPAQATISTTCGANPPCGYINFPQTAVGAPSRMPITVSNTGCPPLTLAVSFTGPDGGTSPYSLVNPAPAMVNFGNAANLEVQYAPTKGGSADFWNLVLTTNDATNPITLIPLTGTSTELMITFQSPMLCPHAISIGNNGQVDVGTTTVVPYTMINNGSLQVKLGIPFIEDGGVGYSVTNAWTAPIIVDGGDTASFDVSFTSPGAGQFLGTVDIPVIGGMDNSCQMSARSIGNICAPDGGIPQQTIVLPPPTDPSMQLCGCAGGVNPVSGTCNTFQVVLYNCGSAPIDFCGIDAGTANAYFAIDAGPFGELPPDASFTIDVSFTDPGVLQSPWIWTYNICNDAQGYANTDAGGGGFQLTVEATTIPVPVQNPPTPPVILSGLDDAGVNPVDGREMHMLAVLPDAGLGNFYQYVWTAAAVGTNDVNVCGDAGFGLWYVDGGFDGGPGIGNNFGGEAYITPVGYWVPGDTHVNQCKICVFAYEVDAGNGTCGFNGGFSPTVAHCFGPITVLDGG